MRKVFKRTWLLLILIMSLSTAPIYASSEHSNSKNAYSQELLPDSNQVYEAIMAQQSVYPTGTPWGDDVYYESKGSGNGSIGYACHAFALVLSDAAFGDYSFSRGSDINNIRVGDILRVYNDTHSVIALRIDGDSITIAEGNYNNSVKWGRTISRSEVNYYWTRYHDSSEFEPKPPQNTPVESVTLSTHRISLEIGDSEDLGSGCIVLPTNATNKTLTWSTSDPNVAFVDHNGVVTAVATGECRITVTSEDGNISDSCSVSVPEPAQPEISVSDLELSPTNLNLKVGDSASVNAEVLPENATNKHVKWEEDDTGVYSISSSNDTHLELRALKAGTAVLTATTEDGGYKRECQITVAEEAEPDNKPVQPDSSSQQSVYRLYNKGNLEHLYTTDENEDRSLINGGWDDEGVGWYAPSTGVPVYRLYSPVTRAHLYTNDDNEVRVLTTQKGWQMDKNGVPMFYSGGSIPVYRLYNESLRMHLLTTDENEYNVLGNSGWKKEGVGFFAKSLPDREQKPEEDPKPDTSKAEIVISPNGADLVVGDTQNFTVTFKNSVPETVKWRSTNPLVASVDDNGKVKALSTGLTWIEATTESGLQEIVPVTAIEGENTSGITGINFGPRDKNNNMPTITLKVKESDLGKVKYDWEELVNNAFSSNWSKPTIYISKTSNPKAEDYYELEDLTGNCEKLFTFYSDEPSIASYDRISKSFTINGYGNALITLGIVGDPSVLSIRGVPNSFSGFITIKVVKD